MKVTRSELKEGQDYTVYANGKATLGDMKLYRGDVVKFIGTFNDNEGFMMDYFACVKQERIGALLPKAEYQDYLES